MVTDLEENEQNGARGSVKQFLAIKKYQMGIEGIP